ncbi:MAG: hypothetical protein AAF399_14890 [Bacteroidota bacterium]
MRITQSTREKLQAILRAQDFSVRYEKGNFQGGHCIVMAQRMILINKFHPLESKINTLAEIIRDIDIDEELLTPDQLKTVQKLKSNQ